MPRQTKMKGGEDKVTKLEVLQENPEIAKALKEFAAEKGMTGTGRMMGKGWWSDFISWLKRNKVISTVSKIGGIIAGAVGALPLATALGAVSTGSSALGYGRKIRGGDARLSIVPPAQRMRPAVPRRMGRGGLTFGYNGAIQPNVMVGRGGSEYNVVSSEFGNIKV